MEISHRVLNKEVETRFSSSTDYAGVLPHVPYLASFDKCRRRVIALVLCLRLPFTFLFVFVCFLIRSSRWAGCR